MRLLHTIAVFALATSASARAEPWHFEFSGGKPSKLVWQTVAGTSYYLFQSPDLKDWSCVPTFPQPGTGGEMEHPFTPGARGFFRIIPAPPAPGGMVLVPAGSFVMGDQSNPLIGYSDERPAHTVYVSAFYMDKHGVTNDRMVEVLNWAHGQGKLVVDAATVKNAQGNQQELMDLDSSDCRILWNETAGRFEVKAAKGAGYPCVKVTWYGAAAWCNYRSEMDGLAACYSFTDWTCDFGANGYRLPTEAEWEKAARGGLAGKNFPWGDTISHSQANYHSSSSCSYDVSPTRGNHPDYNKDWPYTSPAGSFAPNGYGLCDMAGNVWEWCWDRYSLSCYSSSPGGDPSGPPSGPSRVLRGGGWSYGASRCRCASRYNSNPSNSRDNIGFRAVRR